MEELVNNLVEEKESIGNIRSLDALKKSCSKKYSQCLGGKSLSNK
jgi:hypothetical protein